MIFLIGRYKRPQAFFAVATGCCEGQLSQARAAVADRGWSQRQQTRAVNEVMKQHVLEQSQLCQAHIWLSGQKAGHWLVSSHYKVNRDERFVGVIIGFTDAKLASVFATSFVER